MNAQLKQELLSVLSKSLKELDKISECVCDVDVDLDEIRAAIAKLEALPVDE